MTQYEVYQYTYEFGRGFNLINDAYNNISERIAAEDWGLSSIAKNKSNNVFELTDALYLRACCIDMADANVFHIYPCEYAERLWTYCDEYASKKQEQEWFKYNIDDEYRNCDNTTYDDEFKSRELMFFSQEPSNAAVCYCANANVAVYIEPDGFKIILLNYAPSLFSLDNENDKNEIQLYKNECKIRGNFIKQYNGIVFIPFTPYNLKKAILDAGDSASKVLGNLHPLITPR